MLLKNKKYGIADMMILPFRVSPFYSTISALQQLISALLPTFSIYISACFINTAKAVLENNADIKQIYPPILLLASFMVYNVLIDILMDF